MTDFTINTYFDQNLVYNKIQKLDEFSSKIGNNLTIDSVLKGFNLPFSEEDFSPILFDKVEMKKVKASLSNLLRENKFLFFFNNTDNTDSKILGFDEYSKTAFQIGESIDSKKFSINDLYIFANKSNNQIEELHESARYNNISLGRLLSQSILNTDFKDIYDNYNMNNDGSINEITNGALAELSQLNLHKNMTISNMRRVNILLQTVLEDDGIKKNKWVNERLQDIHNNINLVLFNSNKIFSEFDGYTPEKLNKLSLDKLDKINKFFLNHTTAYVSTYYNTKLDVMEKLSPYCIDVTCKKLMEYTDTIKVHKIKLDSDKLKLNEKQKELQKALENLQKAKNDPKHIKFKQSLQGLEQSIRGLRGFSVSGAASDPSLKVAFVFLDVFADLAAEMIKMLLNCGKKGIDFIGSREIAKIEASIKSAKNKMDNIYQYLEKESKELYNLTLQSNNLINKAEIVDNIEQKINNLNIPDKFKHKMLVLLSVAAVYNIKEKNKEEIVSNESNKVLLDEYKRLNNILKVKMEGDINNIDNLSTSEYNEFLNDIEKSKVLNINKQEIVKFMNDNLDKSYNGEVLEEMNKNVNLLNNINRKSLEINKKDPTFNLTDFDNDLKPEFKF